MLLKGVGVRVAITSFNASNWVIDRFQVDIHLWLVVMRLLLSHYCSPQWWGGRATRSMRTRTFMQEHRPQLDLCNLPVGNKQVCMCACVLYFGGVDYENRRKNGSNPRGGSG